MPRYAVKANSDIRRLERSVGTAGDRRLGVSADLGPLENCCVMRAEREKNRSILLEGASPGSSDGYRSYVFP